MKPAPILTCLSLCVLSLAPADEPIKPEIIRPIGRIEREPVKAGTEAIPAAYAADKEVAIKFEDLKPVGERVVMQAVLRIINPTDKPITFTGFSVKNPITNAQHWKDGEWVEEQPLGICGTGLQQCTIAPGQSAVFMAGVYPQTMPTRIGITYTHGESEELLVVWSEKISDR